jgi:hypothetical protein
LCRKSIEGPRRGNGHILDLFKSNSGSKARQCFWSFRWRVREKTESFTLGCTAGYRAFRSIQTNISNAFFLPRLPVHHISQTSFKRTTIYPIQSLQQPIRQSVFGTLVKLANLSRADHRRRKKFRILIFESPSRSPNSQHLAGWP